MWIEIPKKCEHQNCKENATYFFYRNRLFATNWGFYCKEHAMLTERLNHAEHPI